MGTAKHDDRTPVPVLTGSVAEIEELFEHGIPFRFTAYDGSAATGAR